MEKVQILCIVNKEYCAMNVLNSKRWNKKCCIKIEILYT